MLVDVLTSAAIWQSEHPLVTYCVSDELVSQLRVGQLVSIPYGERLVEGIVWTIIWQATPEEWQAADPDAVLRPVHSILDGEPALLPYQMSLAEWIAEYYVTPLAYVAQMMLPPGLLQHSRAVLRLSEDDLQKLQDALSSSSLQMRALIGLLMSDGKIDIERLKETLGAKRAREFLREARSSTVIRQDATLEAPKAKARVKRIVRLVADEQRLAQWREGIVTLIEKNGAAAPSEMNALQMAGSSERKHGEALIDPWGLQTTVNASPALVLTQADRQSLKARHQLAAIDLLLQTLNQATPWTPHALCKASGMTQAHLNELMRERILLIEEAEVRRDPLAGRKIVPQPPLPLTDEQQWALNCIIGGEYDGRPVLLHGVTGSGKTEVYLQAIAAVIKQGKQGIILVPEIALTTQAVLRVAARFPERVAIIHSELSIGERFDEWRRIRSGQVDVVIGSRSALFAPLPDPGIIIIDEEHEPAYKQSERRPTYHARDAAVTLGQILGVPVVMGSATPAVASFYNAHQGLYRLVELRHRVNTMLPAVEVVDLRNELHAGNTSIISRRLQEELEHVLEHGQQAILFLNRRGAASCVLCRDCGYVARCERCDIPMTYHSTERILLCHYCGYQSQVLQFCPQCRGSGMRYFGLGTEKVQETIQKNFPEARLLRWDRDTARNRRAHEQLLDRFANREADILIGTQMIAKGLDLPGVTLVGVVSADIALSMPDYSAAERAFTLLTQVAGRAGRGTIEGRVIVQTFNPQHFCIDTASRHDYHEFYNVEIETRQQYGYPPFRRFVKYTYHHESRYRCQNEAAELYHQLQDWIGRLRLTETDVVGPVPALLERVRGKYHWQLIVRGPDLQRLLRVIEAPGWEIDIDPVSSL
jgi:primosomal protein N' (replication factor Y)